MPQKRGKKSKQEVERSLDELRQIEEQRQQSYGQFVESVQSLQPFEKAEAWLRYVADDTDLYYSDQEALVYLVSRGYDCTDRIKKLVADWKLAERRSIERCMEGIGIYNPETGKTRRTHQMSLTEASDILNRSYHDLDNFWGGRLEQEFSIDATMLRTVEWCNIGGFDEWWHRYVREDYESTIRDGITPIPASFFLFNMCRSDYAIRLMHKALIRILEGVEIPEYRQPYPWRQLILSKPLRAVDHLACAASIVFANEQIRPHHSETEIVGQALSMLQKHQNTEGAWPCWSDDEKPSVQTTAMVTHALAVKKPRGWEIATSAAVDWLWSVQDRVGYWTGPGSPDSVYLTVLVLDALELAKGGSKVTFRLSSPSTEENAKAQYLSDKTEARSMNKIKALFLTANPSDTRKLNLDEQIRLISEKIRAADYRGSIELVSVWAVRSDDLLQSLNMHRPHIVHFSGHGSRTGEILVVGSDGQSKPISTEAIKALFKTLKDNIRVVILDACYSSSQAEAITEIVDCAIGMADAIGENAATIFTASFYRAIGFGRSVQEAFDQGIAALLLENIPEEDTPRLIVKPGVDPSQLFLIRGTNQ